MCGRGGSGWLQLFPSEPKQPVCFLGNSARESVLLSTFTRMHKQNKRLIELEIWLKTFSGENEFEQVCANGKRKKFTKWNGCKYLLICQTLPHQMISLLNGLGKRKRSTRKTFFFLGRQQQKKRGADRQASERTGRVSFWNSIQGDQQPQRLVHSHSMIFGKRKRKKNLPEQGQGNFSSLLLSYEFPQAFTHLFLLKCFSHEKLHSSKGRSISPRNLFFFLLFGSCSERKKKKQLSVTRKCYSLSSVFSVRQ